MNRSSTSESINFSAVGSRRRRRSPEHYSRNVSRRTTNTEPRRFYDDYADTHSSYVDENGDDFPDELGSQGPGHQYENLIDLSLIHAPYDTSTSEDSYDERSLNVRQQRSYDPLSRNVSDISTITLNSSDSDDDNAIEGNYEGIYEHWLESHRGIPFIDFLHSVSTNDNIPPTNNTRVPSNVRGRRRQRTSEPNFRNVSSRSTNTEPMRFYRNNSTSNTFSNASNIPDVSIVIHIHLGDPTVPESTETPAQDGRTSGTGATNDPYEADVESNGTNNVQNDSSEDEILNESHNLEQLLELEAEYGDMDADYLQRSLGNIIRRLNSDSDLNSDSESSSSDNSDDSSFS